MHHGKIGVKQLFSHKVFTSTLKRFEVIENDTILPCSCVSHKWISSNHVNTVI